MSEARTLTVEVIKPKFKGERNFVVLDTVIRANAFKPESVGKKLTCKGNMHEVIEGAHYTLTGVPKWEEKFSEHQFVFHKYELAQTASVTGLQNYLAKECDHIGDGRADQIVGCYGEHTMQVLLTEPEKLIRDITGIGPVEAAAIQVWAKEEEKVSTVKKELYEAGLTSGLIKKLLTAYGAKVKEVLRENAFDTTEVKGIGFLTADRIAKKFGMSATHPQRIREGVIYALQGVMDDQGHTCIEHHILVNAACKLLEIHKEHVINVIKQMLIDKQLCTNRDDPAQFSRYPFLFTEEGSTS
jgi:exodeoxyribonuclease V alpha subunit